MALGDVIGRLSVTLGLDTASFETNARRAAKTTRDTGDGMEALGAKVGTAGRALIGLGAAMAGSQLIQSLKNLTVEGLKHASALEEQAMQLGVTTNELQEYRYAASQAGIESGEMDQALAQLTKRIGIAGTGAGGPAKAFAALGISVRNAKGELITAGEAIPLIANAMAGIKDPAERARLLVELFGKSGQKLEPLLSEGASGVNKLRNAAHELGIVLDEETIRNADKTADKIDKMNTVLKAQVASFVAKNAEEISKLATVLLQFATAALKALNAWMAYRKGLSDRDAWIARGEEAIDKKPWSAERKANAKRELPAQVDKAARDRAGPTESVGPSWLGIKKGPLPKYGQLTSGRGLQIDGGALSRFGVGAVDRTKELIAHSEEFAGAVERIRGSLGNLGAATARNGSAIEVANVRIAKSFKDMADDTLSALDRMASAVKGGGFLDILSAVIGLGLQLGSIGLFGKGVAANINRAGSIPGFANGTSFAPGGLALVGERGPELVNLPRGSQVIPNSALRAGQVQAHVTFGVDPRTGNIIPFVDGRIASAAPAIAMAGARGGEARVFSRQARRVA